jgi:hypothetical protein
MSFKRLEADDFVVSTDSITSGMWVGDIATLTSFFTSSTQAAGASGDYYLNVYSSSAATDIQFAIAYANEQGSGSLAYNTAVDGYSPSGTIYGQYQNLVLGDENAAFVFGDATGSDFFALSIERSRFKETILPGSLTLKIAGSTRTLTLTDDSAYTTTVMYGEAGRIYNIISGSAGVKNSSVNANGWTSASGSYGWLLPDIGTILLNNAALAAPSASGGANFLSSGSVSASISPVTTPMASMYLAISGSSAKTFTLNSQESVTSDFIFVRPRSSEFNYSENPSFISGSTGEVLYSSFINNPQVYITTVGLYNDTNELLAVAKMSRPLLKDFTKEALIRVKLDF